jgi:hypothetical protein
MEAFCNQSDADAMYADYAQIYTPYAWKTAVGYTAYT